MEFNWEEFEEGQQIHEPSPSPTPNAASSGGITNGVDGNIVGVNPLLGPLQNNGGPTMTHALLTGSPAINAGSNCVLVANGCGDDNPALPADQRGFGRVGVVDIGAFEIQAAIEVSISGRVTTSNGRGLGNAIVTMIDSLGVRRTATTSTFGYYSFNGIPGDTYTIAVRSKRYQFQSRTVFVGENLAGMDFLAIK